MSLAIAFEVKLKSFTCGECSGVYALTEKYVNQRIQKGGYWHCPYCECSWGYGTSENDKLKDQLKQKDDQIKREQIRTSTAKAEAAHQKNRARAEKSAKTRIKNRVAAGICPCCNRTFKQLAAHMKNKHPDYKNG